MGLFSLKNTGKEVNGKLLTPENEAYIARLREEAKKPFVSTRTSLSSPWSTDTRQQDIEAAINRFDKSNRDRRGHNRLIRGAQLATAAIGGMALAPGGVLSAGGLGGAAAPVAGNATAPAGSLAASAGAPTGGTLASTALQPMVPYASMTAPASGIGATAAGAAEFASVPGVVSGEAALGTGTVTAPLSSTAGPITGFSGYAANAAPASMGGGGGGAGGGLLKTAAGILTGKKMANASTGLDIAGKAGNAALQYFGQRSANASNDRAAELLAETTRAQQQIERDKMAEDKRQQLLKEAAEKRNFEIAQEERLENLRRVEQKEVQQEPQRMARDQAYRDYMKKYYGYEVAPFVPRTPRTIADGTTVADAPATGGTATAGVNPLSMLTTYGGSVLPAQATPSAAAAATDPLLQGYQLPETEMATRRSLQRGSAEGDY